MSTPRTVVPTFIHRYRPGVYVIGERKILKRLTKQAAAAGLEIVRLSGDVASTKQGFLREVARALRFPDYFGANWDAFNDCIHDLEGVPAQGCVLVYDHFDRFAASEPGQWAIGLRIMKQAGESWERAGRPMYVVLHGSRGAAPGVPVLTDDEARPGRGAAARTADLEAGP